MNTSFVAAHKAKKYVQEESNFSDGSVPNPNNAILPKWLCRISVGGYNGAISVPSHSPASLSRIHICSCRCTQLCGGARAGISVCWPGQLGKYLVALLCGQPRGRHHSLDDLLCWLSRVLQPSTDQQTAAASLTWSCRFAPSLFCVKTLEAA
jgi:hypothetical protein